MSRRTLRINELLREELSVLLQRNVRDPRLNRMLPKLQCRFKHLKESSAT